MGACAYRKPVPIGAVQQSSSKRRNRRGLRFAHLAGLTALCSFSICFPAFAQATDPAAQAAAAIARDQARRATEDQAADRSTREAAPQAKLAGKAEPLGAFPTETPCFPIRSIVVDTKLPSKLRWVPSYLERFKGRCAGHEGLNYILKSLEAAFLDRGLVTTRAGLPAQELSKGVLHIAVVPGTDAGLRGESARDRRDWAVAAPLHKGDLINVRAIEQGLDQMRRVPGRQVAVDLAPGDAPGESLLDLKAKPSKILSGSISVNNFAGTTIGRWQATGQGSLANLLGLNEILTGYYNSRINSPSIPADSKGSGGNFSIPYGWWTFGVAGSTNRYGQHVIGQVQAFDTSGRLSTVSAYVERVVHRDSTSKTSLQVQLQRRWGRSFIDDIEIGLQHQDLTDLQFALMDRHRFGGIQLDGELAYRLGVGLLGAQKDEAHLPANVPTARYRIATLDLTVSSPLGGRLAYRGSFRGQFSNHALYGSDQISIGGPYTVRGYDGDHALLGRSGWYLRQELSVGVSNAIQPYALVDTGGVRGSRRTPVGVGAGLRGAWKGFNLDMFAALPVTSSRGAAAGRQVGEFGVSAGWGF